MRVWIDTDPGFDDLIALALAAESRLEMVGIGLVAGNAPLERIVQNALSITSAFGITAPVYAGADRPLVRPRMTAENVLGLGALGTIGASLPTSTQSLSAGHAVLELIRAAQEQPITLVALGPLTNLALALRLEPRLATWLEGIVLMGGSTDRGNHSAAAEFNFLADPEAASVVFSSGAKITMFGLNLTRQVLLTDAHVARVRQSSAAHSTALADMMAHYVGIRANRQTPLHDPVTIAYLLEPELFTLEPANVQIECTGTHSLGASICEFRAHKAAPNALVAMQTNGEAVLDLILSGIGA